jgi:hypothetical protein
MMLIEYEALKDPEWLPGEGETWADQPVVELQTGSRSDVIQFPQRND